jgi:hypothetical protein
MNLNLSRPRCTALSAAALIATLLSNQALAEGIYQGKTLTILVGTDVGGGFDIYGRAMARHIHKHLPGQPNVIVQNMPGAGSMKAAEYLYGIAPRDGTVIAIVFPAALIRPVMADPENRATIQRSTNILGLPTAAPGSASPRRDRRSRLSRKRRRSSTLGALRAPAVRRSTTSTCSMHWQTPSSSS